MGIAHVSACGEIVKKKSLRSMLKPSRTLVIPGAINAAAALLIEKAGFPAVYISGAGISNGMAGLPDLELITRKEMVWASSYIAKAVKIPALADADTGYGNPSEVAKTVREFEAAGVSAIHLEDQFSPKRCGHLEGKKLITKDQMCAKIRAAVKARKSRDFMIFARTDARGVESFGQAVDRAQAYVQAGADGIFPEALLSLQEFAIFRKMVRVPLIANMTEFGKTPYISVRQFEKLKYNIVLFPLSAFRVMMKQAEEFLSNLAKTGSQKKFLPKMQTRSELYKLLRYDEY